MSSSNSKDNVTLNVVAKRAKVSPSTVSRILNDTARVSESKKRRVFDVIQHLDFRPNLMAKSLARGKSMTVGVLTQFLGSPYYAEALRGIEGVLYDADYAPLFVSGHWNEKEERAKIDVLLSRQVDGLVVFSGCLPDSTLEELAKQVPVVVVGRRLKQIENLISIGFDNRNGSSMIAQHLYQLGHKQLAYIAGPNEHYDAIERFEGFKQAVKELGMDLPNELIVQGDFQESGGYKAAQKLLSTNIPFSALVAGNDQMAFGAKLALARNSLRIPDDVSLVGFDDLPQAAFTNPPLTTVRQSVFEASAIAAKAVLSLLEGEPEESATVEARIVARESVRRIAM